MYLSSKLLQAFKFKGMSKVVTLIGFNLFYINYSRRDYIVCSEIAKGESVGLSPLLFCTSMLISLYKEKYFCSNGCPFVSPYFNFYKFDTGKRLKRIFPRIQNFGVLFYDNI